MKFRKLKGENLFWGNGTLLSDCFVSCLILWLLAPGMKTSSVHLSKDFCNPGRINIRFIQIPSYQDVTVILNINTLPLRKCADLEMSSERPKFCH